MAMEKHIGHTVEVCLYDDSDVDVFGITLRGTLDGISAAGDLARVVFRSGNRIVVPLAMVSAVAA